MNFLGFTIENIDDVGMPSRVTVYDRDGSKVFRYETRSMFVYLRAQIWCILHFWGAG